MGERVLELASTKRAFFFDRDGVLNQAVLREGRPYPPKDVSQLKLVDDAVETLQALKNLGFLLFMVTNQPDVARGTMSEDEVHSINNFLKERFLLDDVRVCIHDDSDLCSCRKPKPGMILDLSKKYDVDLESSFMVGDRWKDIVAGEKSGCKTIFVDYGYSEKQPSSFDFRILKLVEILSII